MKDKKFNEVIVSEILLVIVLLSLDATLILAFISIAIHEFSHILVAQFKGSRFNKVNFNIYGSKVELIDLDELNNKDRFLIYIAGAVSNLIIAMIAKVVYIHTEVEIFNLLMSTNIGLAAFNLIPAYPLDGARLLEIMLTKKISHKRAQSAIVIISYIIATIFIITSILMYIFIGEFNISILLMGLLIIYISKQERKAAMYILMGNIFKKRNNLVKNKFIENRSISVYYKQGLVSLMTLVDKNRFNIFYVLDEDLKVLYVLNEDEVIEGLKEYGNIPLIEYINKKSN